MKCSFGRSPESAVTGSNGRAGCSPTIASAESSTWTVDALAREAALSRSTFFERFSRAVGLPPMEYLLVWRMALAKRLLRTRELSLEQVAERVGYSGAVTFSVAFARQMGMSPTRYARAGEPV